MGMTIDKAIEFFDGLEGHTPQAKDARNVAIETMRKYQKLQADYENRLKVDLVAMLVRLNNEIDDLRAYDDIETVDKCEEIIQQKINLLKEAKDGENND